MNLVHYLLKRGNSNKKMPVQKSHRHFFLPRDWREIGDISGIKSHRHNPTIVSLNRDYLPKLSISIDPISVFCQEYLQQRPHYPLGNGHAWIRSFGNRVTHLTDAEILQFLQAPVQQKSILLFVVMSNARAMKRDLKS